MQISNLRKSIKGLSNEIDRLEKKLGEKNKRYLQVVKSVNRIEDKIFTLKKELIQREGKLKGIYQETKKILRGVIVNAVEDNEDSANLLSTKIFIKRLQKKIKVVKASMRENQELKKMISIMRKRIAKHHALESDLLTMLNDMEANKKVATDAYLKDIREKELLEIKYAKLKDRIKHKKRNLGEVAKKNREVLKLAIRFNTPLEDFAGVEYKTKGITYKFKDVRPVLASRSGKVVYVGSLASYGNVVMIDHGEDIRSILLGEFGPKVKKGMAISSGDIVGYTKNAGGKLGRLYFEVRKKNIAQNTIQIMEDKFRNKILR
ncbi:MAG: peptidoglycan DD-metalloendopeptidase family protein [Bacteriovoracaceae bacterium]|nr:peptidoglycan DD-metalloendopeptidase family protein [Bacteriovoracaceae bacterium]